MTDVVFSDYTWLERLEVEGWSFVFSYLGKFFYSLDITRYMVWSSVFFVWSSVGLIILFS